MADGAPGEEFSFTYDPEAEYEPAETIVRAVAWTKNVGVEDLGPLQNVINIEALIELVTDERVLVYRNSQTMEAVDLHVQFEYEDCRVIVEPDRVRVETA